MRPRQAPQAVVLVEDRDPLPVLSIRDNVAITHLAESQGERLRELWQSLQSRGLSSVGPPFVRFAPATWPAPAEWRTELIQPIA
jgi:hypothetical protein